MKTSCLISFLAVLLTTGCSCHHKSMLSESSTLDFTPKESQHLNDPPTSASFYFNYDGTNFSIVDSRLSNVKVSDFDLEIDGSSVQSGKSKLFEVQLFDASDGLIATHLVSAPSTLRSNFPDDNNATILHSEAPISEITFPLNIKYEKKKIPTHFSIKEVSIANGKVIPIYKQNTQGQILQLDSLMLKKIK